MQKLQTLPGLPISLRDPEIPFCERHAAAGCIGDPLGHPSHREATAEAEALAGQVAPGVLVKVEGMKGIAEAGFKVGQQDVDPAEQRQFIKVLFAGDDSLVMAVVRGHGAEAVQSVGKKMSAGRGVAFSPDRDRVIAEAAHGCDPGVNRMTSLIQGDGCDDQNVVLCSPTRLAARAFSADAGIIQLDLSPQQVSLLLLRHCAQDLVVQQPGCVVVDAQVAAESNEEIPVLAWPFREKARNQVIREFGGLHDRAGRESGLMAARKVLWQIGCSQ
jgi:hypothetical protein